MRRSGTPRYAWPLFHYERIKSLALNRPRRIFLSSSRHSSRRQNSRFVPRALTAGIFGAVAGAALMLLVKPADLFGRAPPPIGDISAVAQDISVVDGETLRLRDTVVRLLGVASPPRGDACRSEDGRLFDCGAASAEALSHLVGNHSVDCHLHGHDLGGRLVAICAVDGKELNHALLAGGWAQARDEGSR